GVEHHLERQPVGVRPASDVLYDNKRGKPGPRLDHSDRNGELLLERIADRFRNVERSRNGLSNDHDAAAGSIDAADHGDLCWRYKLQRQFDCDLPADSEQGQCSGLNADLHGKPDGVWSGHDLLDNPDRSSAWSGNPERISDVP